MGLPIPMVSYRDILSVSRLGSRIARVGAHHYIKTREREGLLLANKSIYRVSFEMKLITPVARIQGSRPLCVSTDSTSVYYGEYRSNRERMAVHVWASDFKGAEWRVVHTFVGIRHVHGVFFDPYTSSLWVTTGDDDKECAIWVTGDRFRTIDRVIGGSQQHRVVQLLFTRTHVYFGSDSPTMQNHLYRMHRKSGVIESLQPVGGPVFYGCSTGESLYFSTAVEPGVAEHTGMAELWGSDDGEQWGLIDKRRKDRWPMGIFQYGQIRFPAGVGDGHNLWYSPVATDGDYHSFKVPVSR